MQNNCDIVNAGIHSVNCDANASGCPPLHNTTTLRHCLHWQGTHTLVNLVLQLFEDTCLACLVVTPTVHTVPKWLLASLVRLHIRTASTWD